MNRRGIHTHYPTDPFVSFLQKHGVEIELKDDANLGDVRSPIKVKGSSRLKKFVCACHDPFIIRAVKRKRKGEKKKISVKCNHCETNFVEATE